MIQLERDVVGTKIRGKQGREERAAGIYGK